VVERHGQITAGDLAAEVGLTTGAVTAMVDRLVAAGLLERKGDPSDRRKVLIQLTAGAKTLADEIYGEMARTTSPYFDALADRDILTLIAFLETSRKVNLELAATVRSRIPKRKVSLRYRIEQAKALKQEAKELVKTVKAEMKDLVSIVVVSGGSRWEQDETGRWVEIRDGDEVV
jgi:DNA-binding MarR family transcriptional regulator